MHGTRMEGVHAREVHATGCMRWGACQGQERDLLRACGPPAPLSPPRQRRTLRQLVQERDLLRCAVLCLGRGAPRRREVILLAGGARDGARHVHRRGRALRGLAAYSVRVGAWAWAWARGAARLICARTPVDSRLVARVACFRSRPAPTATHSHPGAGEEDSWW